MRIKGHQSFHIRRGWIHKGISKVNSNEKVFTDKDIVLTDEFGIGSNMVVSLKYWLETLKLIERKREEGAHIYTLTEIGKIILEKDPYLEEVGTWQLLHYNLATNEEMATTWYWFFNEYEGTKFDRETLFKNLNVYIQDVYYKDISERSLRDDINCLINSYIVKKDHASPEDNIESPFSILRLISSNEKINEESVYQKICKNKLDIEIAYYILLILNKQNKNLDLKKVVYSNGSIGKIFNLNTYEVIDILEKLQNMGYIKFIRTAGLDYITFTKQQEPINIIKNYYNK